MNFKLYDTITTYKVICPWCNQHFSVKDLNNIECKNCHGKGMVDKQNDNGVLIKK